MIIYTGDAKKKVKTAQGNTEDHAADHAGCVPQNTQSRYDARSATLSKIALNCWFPIILRLYRKLYSFRYDCKCFWLTE